MKISYILNVQVVTYVWVTKKSRKRRYSNGNFYSSFPRKSCGRLEGKKENLYFHQHLLLSTILGRTPTMEEYAAVKGLI
jgi:hypothetical protein